MIYRFAPVNISPDVVEVEKTKGILQAVDNDADR